MEGDIEKKEDGKINGEVEKKEQTEKMEGEIMKKEDGGGE